MLSAARAAAGAWRRASDNMIRRCLAATASSQSPGSASGDEDGGADRPCTPWVRTVVSGVDLMRNPK